MQNFSATVACTWTNDIQIIVAKVRLIQLGRTGAGQEIHSEGDDPVDIDDEIERQYRGSLSYVFTGCIKKMWLSNPVF